MRIIKVFAEWLATATVVVLFLITLFVMLGPQFGFDTHPVLSGSMEPTLPVGSVIVTQAVPVEEIKIGDIVTLSSGESLVTHRVVEIVSRDGDSRPWFKTKGDANEEPDSNLLSPRRDHAPKTVIYVPEIGKLSSIARDKATFPYLVGIPVLLLIAIYVREIWQGVKEERRKRTFRTSTVPSMIEGKE